MVLRVIRCDLNRNKVNAFETFKVGFLASKSLTLESLYVCINWDLRPPDHWKDSFVSRVKTQNVSAVRHVPVIPWHEGCKGGTAAELLHEMRRRHLFLVRRTRKCW